MRLLFSYGCQSGRSVKNWDICFRYMFSSLSTQGRLKRTHFKEKPLRPCDFFGFWEPFNGYAHIRLFCLTISLRFQSAPKLFSRGWVHPEMANSTRCPTRSPDTKHAQRCSSDPLGTGEFNVLLSGTILDLCFIS